MQIAEFEAISKNGFIQIPKEYGFADNEKLKVVILRKDKSFLTHQKEVMAVLEDYKENGDKNFSDFKASLYELKQKITAS